jgi:hypothetical protein
MDNCAMPFWPPLLLYKSIKITHCKRYMDNCAMPFWPLGLFSYFIQVSPLQCRWENYSTLKFHNTFHFTLLHIKYFPTAAEALLLSYCNLLFIGPNDVGTGLIPKMVWIGKELKAKNREQNNSSSFCCIS